MDGEEYHVKQWNWPKIPFVVSDEPISVKDFLDVEHDITNVDSVEIVERFSDFADVVVEDEAGGEAVTVRDDQMNLGQNLPLKILSTM